MVNSVFVIDATSAEVAGQVHATLAEAQAHVRSLVGSGHPKFYMPGGVAHAYDLELDGVRVHTWPVEPSDVISSTTIEVFDLTTGIGRGPATLTSRAALARLLDGLKAEAEIEAKRTSHTHVIKRDGAEVWRFEP